MKNRIYIGPDISGTVQTNRIFRDKLPDKVEALAEENTSFARLIVPVDELVAARQNLLKQGSVLAVSYEKAKQINGRQRQKGR